MTHIFEQIAARVGGPDSKASAAAAVEGVLFKVAFGKCSLMKASHCPNACRMLDGI